MALLVTIHLDGIPDKTIAVSNAKLLDVSPSYGVRVDDYETTAEALIEFQKVLIMLLKRPYQQDMNRKSTVDISDIITGE